MQEQQLIEVKVLGITRSEVQAGAYALLLETAQHEPNKAQRIPIVVGIAEAQSIAVRLENIVPTRPLTHDLFTTLFHVYGIELEKVVINNFVEGVFFSMLYLRNDTIEVEIDARTSDAIAIALRTGSPIFVTSDVLAATSFEWHPNAKRKEPAQVRLEDLPITTLQERLQQYVEREQYERAAEIQKIIAQKTNPPQNDK